MKILVVNWQDIKNPLSGGAEVHLWQFFSYFVEKGHNVTLLCSSHKGLPEEENVDGIRVLRRGNRWIFNFQVPFFVRRLLKEEDFDLIVEDVNKIPFFLRFFVKKPIVIITHHFFQKVIFQETNFLFGLYVYLFEKLFFLLYRKLPIITVSQSTCDEMVNHGIPRENIRIVHNAINVEFFRPGEKSKEPLVVYLGRLKRYKRIDLFLKAIKKAQELCKDVGFKVKVVGEGDARDMLERMVLDLNLTGIVEFTGFVPEEEKAKILREAWVIVNTSPKEGWGIVVMEAQASGTTAVVFNSPGLIEAVKDGLTGFVVPFGDVEAVASKVCQIITDKDLREKLSKNAREWALEFELPKLQEKFYKTFWELAKGAS